MNRFKTFISFEGIDYCGKSTQIDLLLNRLKSHKLNVKVLREPGGTTISEKIRNILLDPAHTEMHAHTEILLYSAARAQLVHQTILDELKKGVYVIADRFFDSTTAYQGYGRNIDMDFVHRLNRFATSGLLPYRTFFIDISPEEAEKRRLKIGTQLDRLESEGVEFYRKIREGFLKLAAAEPERIVRIDGELDEQKISEQIWKVLAEIWLIDEKG